MYKALFETYFIFIRILSFRIGCPLLTGDILASKQQVKKTSFVLRTGGTEQFGDSWGYFEDLEGQLSLIAVHSTRTTNPFTQQDLEQQLEYFAKCEQYWVLIIITGGMMLLSILLSNSNVTFSSRGKPKHYPIAVPQQSSRHLS